MLTQGKREADFEEKLELELEFQSHFAKHSPGISNFLEVTSVTFTDWFHAATFYE